MLIVFGGLPGTGKTTLARALAQELHATYLRIDTIEQALSSSAVLVREVGPAGYLVAYALADANLRLGQDVVADSVNPLAITRDAWRKVAATASSAISSAALPTARLPSRSRCGGSISPGPDWARWLLGFSSRNGQPSRGFADGPPAKE